MPSNKQAKKWDIFYPWSLSRYFYVIQVWKDDKLLSFLYKILIKNNVSCQNGLEKVHFWHFFHLKVEMSSFGRILLKIIFFIDNVIKNNICFQKLSFEAFKNHVYKF